MGSALYVKDHALLREIHMEGRAEGMASLLTNVLRSKFGSIPRWAQEKLRRAKPAQLERWATRALTADTLEGILGSPR